MATALSLTAVLLAFAWLAAELWLRRAGFCDFPLFRREEPGVYRAVPSQRGRFLGRHEWSYDARGMRHAGESDLAGVTLLVGDSVVDGGNRIGQAETLPARLAAELGEPVYPVACRGWALANELAALEAMPRWAEAKRLILVVNSGDFETLGEMRDRFMFPTRRPLLALPWLAARQLGRKLTGGPEDRRLPDVHARNLETFRALAARFAGPITLVRYPMKGEDAAANPRFAELHAAAPGSTLLDLADDPEWGDGCYLDHIHPSAKGLVVLARFIGQKAA